MRDDERLRQQRVVFYKNDVARIDKNLAEFIELSKAKCVFLIDKDGHMITMQGETHNYDIDTIAALVAGSFAATKEMARLLGEEEFSVLFHQGANDSIQLSLIGDRTLLATIFDDKTTIGMVRLYSNELSKSLQRLFEEITARGASVQEDADIGENFSSEAGEKLDELFS